MGFRLVSTLITLVFLSLVVTGGVVAYANDQDVATSARIQSLFNQLEIAGNAYNAGGGSATSAALLSSGCGAASSQMGQLLSTWLPSSRSSQSSSFADEAETFFYNQTLSMAGSSAAGAISSGCNALMGGGLSGDMFGNLEDHLILGLIGGGINAANASGLPFLSRLEAETGTEHGEWITSLTTIQPLWRDEAGLNHIFTQLAWRQVDGEDTVNTGLAYRRLSEDKNYLYGLNVFFDHGFAMNHNRMSIGADLQTSLLGGSFNHYIPLSDWKSRDALWEERAAGGYDLEVHGQLPELPSWTASLKGYQWDGSDHQNDDPLNQIDNTYGYVTTLEYSPVPALAVRAGMRDENQESPSAELALRLNLNFNDPLALQFKPRLELASVEDRVYQKVSRENTIRIQERRKSSGLLTVIENSGANLADGQPGIVSLTVGQTLLIPTIVSVANTVGAVARLRLSDGGVLTLGQSTQVRIEPGLLTLLNGTAQYVSGSTNVTVNVPGGTITLMGTDIDMVSNGTDTTVRAREGTIRFDGTTAGSTTLSASQMAQSVAGTISTVAAGSGTYIAHSDSVSSRIDRIASAQTGIKVAPYPTEAPRLITTSTTPGQTIVIGLRFNTSVTSTGGPSRLAFTINGQNRTVSLSSGSGTNDLRFSYTLQIADVGASSTFTVTAFDNNGATIAGDGKTAITTIADTTLDLGAAVGNTPTLAMDFINNTYSLLGTTYNSLTSFLTAASGTFTRASTATYFDASGTLQTASAGTPRFDHDPVTHAAKGLLIEESRTNLLTRSSEFDDASWTKSSQIVVNADSAIAPDGTLTADILSENSTSYERIGKIIAVPNDSSSYTITLYVKKTSGGSSKTFSINYGIVGGGVPIQTNFRLNTDTGLTNIGSSQDVGSYWRIKYSIVNNNTGNTSLYVDIYPATGNHGNFSDIPSVTGSAVIWGAQLERGTFPTSYIPTTAASVTREADTVSLPMATWFNSSSGTYNAEFQIPQSVTTNPRVLSYDTSGTPISIDPTNKINWFDGSVLTTANSVNLNTVSKAAASYTATTKHVVLNGSTVASGSINGGFPVSSATIFRLGNEAGVSRFLNGWISKAEYYPIRLPDATLQTLTTP